MRDRGSRAEEMSDSRIPELVKNPERPTYVALVSALFPPGFLVAMATRWLHDFGGRKSAMKPHRLRTGPEVRVFFAAPLTTLLTLIEGTRRPDSGAKPRWIHDGYTPSACRLAVAS